MLPPMLVFTIDRPSANMSVVPEVIDTADCRFTSSVFFELLRLRTTPPPEGWISGLLDLNKLLKFEDARGALRGEHQALEHVLRLSRNMDQRRWTTTSPGLLW